MRAGRNLKGTFTLFYAGILLSTLALLGGLLESARVHAVKLMMADSSYLALQNVMAGYQRELWDEYHVFFVDLQEAGGETGVLTELQDSLTESFTPVGGFFGRDWMGVSCKGIQADGICRMTDEQGRHFEKQVMAYMKYRAGADVMKQLLEQLGVMQGLDKAKGILDRKLQLEQKFAALEEKKNKALERLEEMRDLWGALDEVKESLEDKLRMQAAAEKSEAAKEEESAGEGEPVDILPEKEMIYRTVGKLLRQNKEVRGFCRDYRNAYPEAQKALQEYEAELEENREEVGEIPWQTMREDLEELKSYERSDGPGYMSRLENSLSFNEGILDALLSGSQDEGTSAGSLLSLVNNYQSELLPDQYELPDKGRIGDNPIERYKKLLSQGILSLVLPPGQSISERTLTPAAWQEQTGGALEEESGRILLSLYAAEHFGCYTDPQEDTALLYEREYLMMGKDNDLDNLAGTASVLLSIRTAADFLHLLTQPDRVAQARELAVAIAGLTGLSPLITVIKTGILLAWAFDQAVKETSRLYQGEKVALYADWTQVELDYSAYLLLLSLFAGRSAKTLRMIRLVEGNTQIRHKECFQAAECAGGFRMETEAYLSPHFVPDGIAYRESFELAY